MRKKGCCFLGILLLINAGCYGQLSESFNEDDFDKRNKWAGDTADFRVNGAHQLQSNNAVANASFYLSTKNELAINTEWEFYVKLDFNPSSANYVDVFLVASGEDLKSATNSGYFIRAGGTNDNICLYRKDGNASVKLIDGEANILNHASNQLKIKVRRDSSGWKLYRDITASGQSYTVDGRAVDNTYLSSAFFGILIKQSTASFFQKHFFDDIEIKEVVADRTPPKIISATAVSAQVVRLFFDKEIEKNSYQLSDFFGNDGLGFPASAIAIPGKGAAIQLTFEKPFTNGHVYTINVSGVKDVFGNDIVKADVQFAFYSARRYDVVIDEIFPKPVAAGNLPNYEWIELKNTSAFPVNVKGWTVSNHASASALFPDLILQPDSFVIVTSTAAAAALSKFGKTIGVSRFPSLNNDADLLTVFDENGSVIHAVEYSSDWYNNELKKQGGWSLEMVDPKNACGGAGNWKASGAANGATPGSRNYSNAPNADTEAPAITHAFATGQNTVIVNFNKSLDSTLAGNTSSFHFDHQLTATAVRAIPPLFKQAEVTLSKNIEHRTVYGVTVSGVSDCAGNIIGGKNHAGFGLAEAADSLDLVVNEILFNPLPDGVDYVEIYNRSNKIVDLNKIYIANRSSSRDISSIYKISEEPRLLFPKDYMTITTDPAAVKRQYIAINPDAFIKVKSMPSYPNDKGNVILLNEQGMLIDEVGYLEKWHFELIANPKGVALERIDPEGPSIKSNFHSAAASVGYGTPGYKNSQSVQTQAFAGAISVEPQIFSPDNDGQDDFALVKYRFPQPGFIANITVFDAVGRVVRYLQKNALCGHEGFFRWDGLDEKSQPLPRGIYLVFTEIFHADGSKKQFKNTLVLARRSR